MSDSEKNGLDDLSKFTDDILKTNPELEAEAREYLDSSDCPNELKNYNLAFEKGKQNGEAAGFWKGVFAGGLIGSSLAVITVLGIKAALEKKE